MVISTEFTEQFGVAAPLVLAPMAGVAYAELAAAVAKGGGLGFVACGIMSSDEMQKEYEKAITLVEDEDPQHSVIGLGLINFLLKRDMLDAALSCHPAAIWLAFSEKLEDWDELAIAVKDAGIRLMCQVQSVEQALHVAKLGADAIVAQGNESGGHGASRATSFCFTPELVDALRAEGFSTPVLVAGGVCDGRQVAAALALGADGVVMGTRMVATTESRYPDHLKQAYVAASDGWQGKVGGERTTLWDELGHGPEFTRLGWPSTIDGRALENVISRPHVYKTPIREADKLEIYKVLEEGKAARDAERSIVWAGGGVGLIHSLEPAEQVVRSTMATASQVLARLASIVK